MANSSSSNGLSSYDQGAGSSNDGYVASFGTLNGPSTIQSGPSHGSNVNFMVNTAFYPHSKGQQSACMSSDANSHSGNVNSTGKWHYFFYLLSPS